MRLRRVTDAAIFSSGNRHSRPDLIAKLGGPQDPGEMVGRVGFGGTISRRQRFFRETMDIIMIRPNSALRIHGVEDFYIYEYNDSEVFNHTKSISSPSKRLPGLARE